MDSGEEIYILRSIVLFKLWILRVQLTLKNKPTMENVVVHLLVVFSGIVLVAWAPILLGKETTKTTLLEYREHYL